MTINAVGWFSILLLYLVWAIPYKSYHVAKTRSQLFELRHRLFMLGKNEEIDFDAPAYRAAEKLLNAFIRYAHRLTFGRMLANQIIKPKSADIKSEAQMIESTIDAHPNEEIRAKIKAIISEAALTMLVHAFMTFLPTWLIINVAQRVHSLRNAMRTAVKGMDKQINIIEADALRN